MIQIKCNNCDRELSITEEKCPYCGDPVEIKSKFYCGNCENKIDIKKQICKKCNEIPEEIIIEQSNGKRIRTKFETKDIASNDQLDSEESDKESKTEEEQASPDLFERTKKLVYNDLIIMFALDLTFFIVSVFTEKYNFLYLIFSIILLFGAKKAQAGSKAAGTIGIIIGLLMILTIITGDVVDMLVGIFVLVHAIEYNKSLEKQNIK